MYFLFSFLVGGAGRFLVVTYDLRHHLLRAPARCIAAGGGRQHQREDVVGAPGRPDS